MSRAMTLTLPEAKVRGLCDKSGVSISSLEAREDGGCHLVCTTSDGADEIRTKLTTFVVAERVRHSAFTYHLR